MPTYLPKFDSTHQRYNKLNLLLLEDLIPQTSVQILQPIRIQQHINNLKNNKATDPFGVSAEHFTNADTSLIPALTTAINNIFRNQDIPDNMKLGIIIPVGKKKP